MSTLLSVIVPVYNVENYLPKCLNSIINQTYKNIEIILVDDGSTDNSGKICDEYSEKDNRIVVLHKENGGQSDVRNKGLEIAHGEYICFVDSDDYLEEDALSILIENCVFNGIVCYGLTSVYLPEGNIKIKKSNKYYSFSKMEALKAYLSEMANWDNKYTHDYFIGSSMNTKLFHKNIFKNLRFSTEIKSSEDIDLMMDIILKANNIILLPVAKYYYVHQNNFSITNKPFNLQMLDDLRVRIKIEERVKKSFTNYLEYAQKSTLFGCVYLIGKIARLDNNERKKYKKVIKTIKQEIYARKVCFYTLTFKAKLKIYTILYFCNLYMTAVRLIRTKFKI